MVGGGLMQLVAYGVQDCYLINDSSYGDKIMKMFNGCKENS